ncbi:hypothetical protein BgiMline_036270, partial [Biomphalaria glabrata]
ARATRASPWSLPGSSEQSFVSSGHGQAIATATITSTHTGKETSRVPDSPTRASPKTLNSLSPGIPSQEAGFIESLSVYFSNQEQNSNTRMSISYVTPLVYVILLSTSVFSAPLNSKPDE